ncbi:MAG TPA: 3-oxoacyl-[acyl-carrier-protein] reductase [Syntrophomonadaceae bacterium]|nr:3-oxoacyl-[acyl-carrier-protein] reductase [Syntrophomonadaceae bacterium]
MFLENQVALVTGASQGIGRAIALALARAGARIAVNYYPDQIDRARQVVDEIKSSGSECIMVGADVSNKVDVEAMIAQVLEHFGSLDILVNNAGITRDQLLLRMRDEDWHSVLNTNLTGVFYCSRAALKPMLKNRWGRIINIASVVGITGNAGQANYAAAKAGVIGFTKSLAREVASRGITVNAIAPGYIETEMTGKVSDRAKEQFLKSIPLGRPGRPEDVAGVVVFLASHSADYITGQTIHVDGGMVL